MPWLMTSVGQHGGAGFVEVDGHAQEAVGNCRGLTPAGLHSSSHAACPTAWPWHRWRILASTSFTSGSGMMEPLEAAGGSAGRSSRLLD